MLSQISACSRGCCAWASTPRSIDAWRCVAADAFWTAWYGWLLALVFYDFCYYWLHRAGHESAVFWAAHVVHHQSQDYNLSTALRQTSSGALLGWMFYLPMAVAGVPPLVFGVVALVDLLYQFWVHTEQVGQARLVRPLVLLALQPPRAPRGQRPLPRPQLRRHADRLGPPVRQLPRRKTSAACTARAARCDSWDPLWANAEVYWALARDSWHARALARQAAACGSSRRAGGRPTWRRAFRSRLRHRRGAALPPAGHAAASHGSRGAAVRRCCCAAWRCSCGMRTACRFRQSAVWLGALAAGLWAVGRGDAGPARYLGRAGRSRRAGDGHRRARAGWNCISSSSRWRWCWRSASWLIRARCAARRRGFDSAADAAPGSSLAGDCS